MLEIDTHTKKSCPFMVDYSLDVHVCIYSVYICNKNTVLFALCALFN